MIDNCKQKKEPRKYQEEIRQEPGDSKAKIRKE